MDAVPLYRSSGCFGCGTENDQGLGLAPAREGRRVFARFTPRPEHRSYTRAVHGGITAALLDEVCGLSCSQRVDGKCATVELTVRFRRPLRVGVPVVAEASFLRRSGRFLLASGRIVEEEGGKVLATAHGKFLELDPRMLAKFVDDGQNA